MMLKLWQPISQAIIATSMLACSMLGVDLDPWTTAVRNVKVQSRLVGQWLTCS